MELSVPLIGLDALASGLLGERAGDVRPGLAGFPLQVPRFGTTVAERTRLHEAAEAELTRRGLVRRGRVDADLTAALRLLSRGRVAVAALGMSRERPVRARVVADETTAVLANVLGNEVVFELGRAESVAPMAVGVLPMLSAAPVDSVTVSRGVAARRSSSDSFADEDVFGEAQDADPGTDYVHRLFARPRRGAGYFTVLGGRSLNWVELVDGAFMQLTERSAHGVTVSIAPADTGRLVLKLRELIG